MPDCSADRNPGLPIAADRDARPDQSDRPLDGGAIREAAPIVTQCHSFTPACFEPDDYGLHSLPMTGKRARVAIDTLG